RDRMQTYLRTAAGQEAESMDLSGKTAIVTGGAGGIGAASARLLARLGAAVVVADLNGAAAVDVATEIAGGGQRAVGVEVDVSDEKLMKAMIARAVETFGGLDMLFNNAAATGPLGAGQDGIVTEQDVDAWDRTMQVNLRGPMFGCKHAIPR